ncbi:MAG: metallophosphoesterase [Polyangiales bacterium]
MSILAHLSDLHLLERDHDKRRGLPRRRLRYLSTGAPLDYEGRLQRAIATLQVARRANADHVLITGDLTEDGTDAQFEVLAEALQRSGLSPDCVTLVPGNHDGYADAGAFARALQGPLAAFRGTSAENAKTVLSGAVIAPVSTMIDGQWFGRSRGEMRNEDVARVRRLASDPISKGRAVVVAQHHPPKPHALFAWDWIDGLGNAHAMRDLLLERTRVHVVHGHTHRRTTQHLTGRLHAQVFSTASVRDQHGTGLALRFYQAEDGSLHELQGLLPTSQPLAAQPATPVPLAFTPSAL